MRGRWIAVALPGLLAVSAAAGCEPAVPSAPTYEADVRPILMSRCVRCHGAGGTLNAEIGLDGGELNPAPSGASPYLDHFEDRDCTVDPDSGAIPDGCQRGAGRLADLIDEIVNIADRSAGGMPPVPAPALDSWQKDVIHRWSMNPICTTPAKPDPTICPPGS